MDFQMIENESPQGTIIKVVGVGGAGNNAVQHMINKKVQGVEFICLNTDAQALYRSSASHKLRLGKTGLGAGARPEVGKSSAEEAREEIKQLLAGAHMVFITAGMGGGTGTGAAPVVARIAKEMGILTVGVVSKPFEFEGLKRMNVAEIGANELQSHVDSLIIVLNERLFSVMGEDAEMDKCFECADDVLHNAVAGIAEIINVDGLINVDFEDVKTVMSEQGKAMMGTATVSGQDRARLAAEDAVSSPLLEGVDLSGARGILVNITASRSLKLSETKQVMNTIRSYAAKDATVIFGSVYDENMGDALRVTVVATGLGGVSRIPEQTSEIDLEKSIQYATHQLQDRHGSHLHTNNHGPITINTFGASQPPQNSHNPYSQPNTSQAPAHNTNASLNINNQPYSNNTTNNPLWNNTSSNQKTAIPHNLNQGVNKPATNNASLQQNKESFEVLAEVPAFLRNQKLNNSNNNSN